MSCSSGNYLVLRDNINVFEKAREMGAKDGKEYVDTQVSSYDALAILKCYENGSDALLKDSSFDRVTVIQKMLSVEVPNNDWSVKIFQSGYQEGYVDTVLIESLLKIVDIV